MPDHCLSSLTVVVESFVKKKKKCSLCYVYRTTLTRATLCTAQAIVIVLCVIATLSIFTLVGCRADLWETDKYLSASHFLLLRRRQRRTLVPSNPEPVIQVNLVILKLQIYVENV